MAAAMTHRERRPAKKGNSAGSDAGIFHLQGRGIALCGLETPAETADPYEFPDSPDQQTRKQNRADKLEKKGNDNKNNVRHID